MSEGRRDVQMEEINIYAEGEGEAEARRWRLLGDE